MTRWDAWLALLVAGSAAGTSPAGAQSPAEFAALARSGTARYGEQAQALADGYHALGPEAPGMGQHWVQPRLLLQAGLDPARPPILTYATVGGRPVLVAVAYVVPLAAGAPSPPPPVPGAVWHFHAGSVVEEAHLVRHAGHGDHEITHPRMAVLHAWIWVENPAGLFEPDNWSLPYLRAGIPAPSVPAPDVAQGLALAAGASAFFATQLAIAAGVNEKDADLVRGVVEAAATGLAGLLESHAAGAPLSEAEEQAIRQSWHAMIASVLGCIPAEARVRLEEALPGHTGT